MARSPAALDYSIDESVDEVLSKRTTFSTLMRPDNDADEYFLSTLYDLDATSTTASPKQSIQHQGLRVSTGTHMSDERDASSIHSDQDLIRRAYIEVMARRAFNEARAQSGYETRETPELASSHVDRRNQERKYCQSPAARMAARLRHAHDQRSLVMVASLLEEKQVEKQVESANHMAARLRRAHLTVVTEEENQVEPANHLSRFKEVKPRTENFAPLSPAQRMASRVLLARQEGATGLVLVSSKDETAIDAMAVANFDAEFGSATGKLDDHARGHEIKIVAGHQNALNILKETSTIQDELAALRSRKLATKEGSKLKDAAPMSTPEVLEALLRNNRDNLKRLDSLPSSPIGTPRKTATNVFTDPKYPPQNHSVHGLAASSKTGLESALQEITKTSCDERLWWDLKQLSSNRKAKDKAKRSSEPFFGEVIEPVSFDNKTAAEKAIHAADTQLRNWAKVESTDPTKEDAALSDVAPGPVNEEANVTFRAAEQSGSWESKQTEPTSSRSVDNAIDVAKIEEISLTSQQASQTLEDSVLRTAQTSDAASEVSIDEDATGDIEESVALSPAYADMTSHEVSESASRNISPQATEAPRAVIEAEPHAANHHGVPANETNDEEERLLLNQNSESTACHDADRPKGNELISLKSDDNQPSEQRSHPPALVSTEFCWLTPHEPIDETEAILAPPPGHAITSAVDKKLSTDDAMSLKDDTATEYRDLKSRAQHLAEEAVVNYIVTHHEVTPPEICENFEPEQRSQSPVLVSTELWCLAEALESSEDEGIAMVTDDLSDETDAIPVTPSVDAVTTTADEAAIVTHAEVTSADICENVEPEERSQTPVLVSTELWCLAEAFAPSEDEGIAMVTNDLTDETDGIPVTPSVDAVTTTTDEAAMNSIVTLAQVSSPDICENVDLEQRSQTPVTVSTGYCCLDYALESSEDEARVAVNDGRTDETDANPGVQAIFSIVKHKSTAEEAVVSVDGDGVKTSPPKHESIEAVEIEQASQTVNDAHEASKDIPGSQEADTIPLNVEKESVTKELDTSLGATSPTSGDSKLKSHATVAAIDAGVATHPEVTLSDTSKKMEAEKRYHTPAFDSLGLGCCFADAFDGYRQVGEQVLPEEAVPMVDNGIETQPRSSDAVEESAEVDVKTTEAMAVLFKRGLVKKWESELISIRARAEEQVLPPVADELIFQESYEETLIPAADIERVIRRVTQRLKDDLEATIIQNVNIESETKEDDTSLDASSPISGDSKSKALLNEVIEKMIVVEEQILPPVADELIFQESYEEACIPAVDIEHVVQRVRKRVKEAARLKSENVAYVATKSSDRMTAQTSIE